MAAVSKDAMHVYLAFVLIGAALLVAAHAHGVAGKAISLGLCGGGVYVLYSEYAELLRRFEKCRAKFGKKSSIGLDSVL